MVAKFKKTPIRYDALYIRAQYRCQGPFPISPALTTEGSRSASFRMIWTRSRPPCGTPAGSGGLGTAWRWRGKHWAGCETRNAATRRPWGREEPAQVDYGRQSRQPNGIFLNIGDGTFRPEGPGAARLCSGAPRSAIWTATGGCANQSPRDRSAPGEAKSRLPNLDADVGSSKTLRPPQRY